ncbi:glycosyl hydrolase 2 galactose-binding domain-containing protein [Pedobacter sp. UC225_61]|uniref:glycosyl hydrolase 2 galactose-binding domain-containing protein n=1 Tax=Pedobacter sp. UC225_61 TaxID=3374623 RepID=UPI0037B4F6B5
MLKLNYKCSILFLVIGLSLAFKVNAQVSSQKLTANWSFQEQDDAKWYPAKVPGEVHVDLMTNKLIPDPFYRDNEKKLQWIEKENWDYKSAFSVLSDVFQKQHVELVFDGLDTYADVYLNGKLILQANNMFRQWKIDVKKVLKQKDNKLLIRFRSAQNTV